MKKYSHFDNYDKLMKKLNSFSNPVSFFNFVSENELTGDLTYQSDEVYSQEAFNRFVQDFGIEISEDSVSVSEKGLKSMKWFYENQKIEKEKF